MTNPEAGSVLPWRHAIGQKIVWAALQCLQQWKDLNSGRAKREAIRCKGKFATERGSLFRGAPVNNPGELCQCSRNISTSLQCNSCPHNKFYSFRKRTITFHQVTFHPYMWGAALQILRTATFLHQKPFISLNGSSIDGSLQAGRRLQLPFRATAFISRLLPAFGG